MLGSVLQTRASVARSSMQKSFRKCLNFNTFIFFPAFPASALDAEVRLRRGNTQQDWRKRLAFHHSDRRRTRSSRWSHAMARSAAEPMAEMRRSCKARDLHCSSG